MRHLAYENVTTNVKISPSVEKAAKAWLSTYLSAYIDEVYSKTITYANIIDPSYNLLKKIEEIPNPINSFTNHKAKRVWSSITFQPNMTKKNSGPVYWSV